jgi:nucleoside triphosphate diphosphatase
MNSEVKTQIEKLIEIMALLRDPEKGCPWDIDQTFESIAPYTIEEAYEVVEAIEQKDMSALVDELGDLLLQVVFHARLAEEVSIFSFDDVVQAICDKLVRRHPHVFSDSKIHTAEAQIASWEAYKALEREEKASSYAPHSALDGVTRGLPALTRALKLQKRAARVGFDWSDARDVLDKFDEEIKEMSAEMTADPAPERQMDEMGDLLFTCVNLARKLNLDPETALRHGNAKFERRFKGVEALLAKDGKTPETSELYDMEVLWDKVKLET